MPELFVDNFVVDVNLDIFFIDIFRFHLYQQMKMVRHQTPRIQIYDSAREMVQSFQEKIIIPVFDEKVVGRIPMIIDVVIATRFKFYLRFVRHVCNFPQT